MYLFTRRLRARTGGINDAMAWATAITEKARQITGLEVGLSASVFGPQVGTVAFTAFVPDLATLEMAGDKLQVDSGYLDLVEQGQTFAPEGADDRLLQFVFPDEATLTAPPAADQPQWQYASVVQSVCTGGNVRKGIELGIQLAVKGTEITGIPTAFLVDTTGPYGGVNWLSVYPDAAAVDAANAALSGNDEWLTLVDEGVAGVYNEDPAATQQTLYRRIL